MEREKFDPSPSRNPLTNGQQNFVKVTASGVTTTTQNFIQIGSGVSVLRMRDFATLDTKWLGYIFGCSWERLQPRRAHRFWRKIRHTTRFRASSAFWGSWYQNLRFRLPFSPKTDIFGTISTGQYFSAENGFNIGRLESRRPLIVVVAQ